MAEENNFLLRDPSRPTDHFYEYALAITTFNQYTALQCLFKVLYCCSCYLKSLDCQQLLPGVGRLCGRASLPVPTQSGFSVVYLRSNLIKKLLIS